MSPPNRDPVETARALMRAGDLPKARAFASRFLDEAPNNQPMRAVLGMILIRQGDPASALPHLQAAADHAPGTTPGLLNALANAYKMLARPDDALRAAERVLESNPDSAPALRIKASVLRTTGRAQEGLLVIEPLAAAHPENAAIACELADTRRALRRLEDALKALAPHAQRTDLPEPHRRAVHIRRAQILDELDRPDDAFAAATRANESVNAPRVTHADPLIDRWPRSAIDRMPRSRARGVTPVLVVGMPRSGTTLLERIISAHPSAAGAGECPTLPALLDEHARRSTPPDQRWADHAGATYLEALTRAGPSATHVVDKMPANVFTLALAERLAPDAKIIHVRRDPRDVCLSCYFQELNDSMAFTRDLESCARQHLEIDRLMDHWRSTVTLPWSEVRYEDLVTDAEGTVRRMLDFLGLEFNEQCLAFHRSTRHVETASWAQVTRPLYATSIARWKRFEPHLTAMLRILAGPAT